MSFPLCIHCNKWHGCRPRGLCTKCFNDVEIRVKYPLRSGGYNTAQSQEPTMEEVEAMIAERYPTMPGGVPEGQRAAERRRKQWRVPVFKRDRRSGNLHLRND